MRLWAIQGIEIYEQLERDGVTYCTKPSWGDEDNFMYAWSIRVFVELKYNK